MSEINWGKLRAAVVERIEYLQIADEKLELPGRWKDKFRQDLIMPHVELLAQFCAAIKVGDEVEDDPDEPDVREGVISLTADDLARFPVEPSWDGQSHEVLDGPEPDAAVVSRLVMTLELLDELLCSEQYDEAIALVQATLVGNADPKHVRERLEELRGGQAPRATTATAGGIEEEL